MDHGVCAGGAVLVKVVSALGLVSRHPSLKETSPITEVYCSKVGDIFECLLGIWNRVIPQAQRIRQRIVTHCGAVIEAFEYDMKVARNHVGQLAKWARQLAASGRGKEPEMLRKFILGQFNFEEVLSKLRQPIGDIAALESENSNKRSGDLRNTA